MVANATLSKVLSLHNAVNRGRRARGEAYLPSLLSTAHLALFKEFSPKEIASCALYSRRERSALPVLISKQASLSKLRRGNPVELQYKTEDKVAFYRICEAAGLPIPRFFGVIAPDRIETAGGQRLATFAEWRDHVANALPEHFVTKDVGGAYASGFQTYQRQGDRFVERSGSVFDSEGLYNHLRRQNRRLLLQEQAFDHPDLTRLCGRRTLQSIRITTRRNTDGSVDILFYFHKVVCGNNIADNFLSGNTGNILTWGDREPLVLRGGRAAHPQGGGLITVERHPDTGIAFNGFELPYWREAYDLVVHAHGVFAEFATIGWDVALTADGPKLLEANAWWDPPTFAPHIMAPEDWRAIFG